MELNELHKKFLKLSALLMLAQNIKSQIKDVKFLEDEHDTEYLSKDTKVCRQI